MFRLLRTIVTLVLLAGVTYVAVAVPLGDKTLWQHLRAIAATEESQQLVDGIKQKAGRVLDDEGEGRRASSKEIDRHTAEERARLRELIQEQLAKNTASAAADDGVGASKP